MIRFNSIPNYWCSGEQRRKLTFGQDQDECYPIYTTDKKDFGYNSFRIYWPSSISEEEAPNAVVKSTALLRKKIIN
jgi:hypothetical protein